MKRVDEFLYGIDLESNHKANLRFYLAMYAVCVVLRSARPRRTTIAALNLDALTDQLFVNCLGPIQRAYLTLGGDDTTAKGPELNEVLQGELQARFGRGKTDRALVA